MTPRDRRRPRRGAPGRTWRIQHAALPQRCPKHLCALLGRDLLRSIRVVAALEGLSPEQWIHAVVTRALRARCYRGVVQALADDDTPDTG